MNFDPHNCPYSGFTDKETEAKKSIVLGPRDDNQQKEDWNPDSI